MTRTASNISRAAETRAYRVIALAFGPAAIVFGLLVEPAIVEQWSHYALWWSVLAMIGLYAVPFVLCAVSFIATPRQLRSLAAAGAVAYLAAVCLVGPALGGHHLIDQSTPWILDVATIGTTLAALAWRMRIAGPAIVVSAAFVAVDRVAAGGSELLGTALQDALYTFMFSIVFAALAQVAIRSGRHVDSAAEAVRAEATVAASARARLQEQSRINALVHDSVLATLLAAGRGEEQPYGLVREQALRGLAQLSRLQLEGGDAPSVGAVEFVWALQAMTTDIVPTAVFSHEVESAQPIPPDVAEAISEASLEALRNSAQHAHGTGQPVNRAIHVSVSESRVEVEILDDGVGFDPARVASTRLGVSVSILERMRWLDRGQAQVISLPGVGTRVALTWSRQ